MMEGGVGAWAQRRWRAHVLLGIAVAATIAIGRYPRLGAFLPPCPMHKYFGILCPGCGGTRAVVALLHGQFRESVRLNPLFVILLPFAIWFGAESYRRAVRRREFEWPHVSAALVYGMAVASFVFAVLRNVMA